LREIDRIGRQLLKYPNVTGYSKRYRYRIRRGKVIKELCLQVHVVKKVPEKKLRIQDVLPKEIEGIPVDVVEYGLLRIPPLLEEGPEQTKARESGKTGVIRPLVAGVSIGNYAITAGTLGDFVVKTKNPDQGEHFMASNAHVLVDEPARKEPVERTIIQPGRADGGSLIHKVGEYYWHKQIIPQGSQSPCSITNAFCFVFNSLAKVFGRKSRVEPYISESNKIDFAVASLSTRFKPTHYDKIFSESQYACIGYGFAGSEQVSLVCKGKYIEEEGYKPVKHSFVETRIGDLVEKSSRNCYSRGKVLDDSAYEIVSYGVYSAAFDDVIITERILYPGCSGSAIYKLKP